MTDVQVMVVDREDAERIQSMPLAHLSIEVGHLYMEDFEAGPARIRALFDRVAPWVETAADICRRELGTRKPRISTAFLIDDYFTTFSSPREVLPMVLRCADEAGLRIDYIARESSCAAHDDVALAELVLASLVADPPPGTDGTRPPPQETGWLCNGVRTADLSVTEAMAVTSTVWQPPSENGAHRHSVFLDVELWNQSPHRLWSCPYLAAIWQLLRLGVLRDEGRSIGVPQSLGRDFPAEWAGLPPVAQINESAAPFAAYRTFSVLDSRFLPIEHAVRTILGQVCVDDGVYRQIKARADREGVTMDRDLASRTEYAFIGRAWMG